MSRDLRKYARQTNFRLAIGALALIFIIGDGLIYLFYGSNAAMLGLLCLMAGLVPILLVIFILFFLEWIRKRVDRD